MSHRTIARNKPPIAPHKPLRPFCDCVQPNGDALTCLATKHRMSRFNAMIVFGASDQPGRCTCACHQKARIQ